MDFDARPVNAGNPWSRVSNAAPATSSRPSDASHSRTPGPPTRERRDATSELVTPKYDGLPVFFTRLARTGHRPVSAEPPRPFGHPGLVLAAAVNGYVSHFVSKP